jgi:hypothetical protein
MGPGAVAGTTAGITFGGQKVLLAPHPTLV